MLHIFRLVLRQLSKPLFEAKWRFVPQCFPLGGLRGQKFLSYIPAKPAEKKDRSSTGESTVTGCVCIAHKLQSTSGGWKFKHRLEATFRKGQERRFRLMVLLSTGLWHNEQAHGLPHIPSKNVANSPVYQVPELEDLDLWAAYPWATPPWERKLTQAKTGHLHTSHRTFTGHSVDGQSQDRKHKYLKCIPWLRST